MSTTNAPWAPNVVEGVAKILADTSDGLTGSEIGDLLHQLGIVDPASGSTKWRRLNEALLARQTQDRSANQVIAFIYAAMDPVRYRGNPSTFTARQDALNEVLVFAGLRLNDAGKLVTGATAETLTEAARHTYWAGASDADRKKHKSDRRRLQKEMERTFPLPDGIDPVHIPATRKLDAPPYALAGETFPSIESNISHYLDDPGDTLWKGVYTYLCARGTHASLGSAQFIDRSPTGTGFTLSDARLVWLVRATLSAYGRALEHLVQWCGWDTAPVEALIDGVALLDPTAYLPD